MFRLKVLLSASLLLATLPGVCQRYDTPTRGGDGQYGDNRNQNDRRSSNFNSGLREGGRGGDYYDRRHANDGYDERYQQNGGYYQQQRGGIGPGKGALIGGASGAVLGAVFGGGLKGTIIGGAAGAGIGAVIGQAHQNSERQDDYYRR
jgi:hypothetical protein